MPANNTNAYALWKAAAIAATNVDFHSNWLQTSSSAVLNQQLTQAFTTNFNISHAPILTNVAVKGGFNAIRVFLPLREYKVGAQANGAPIVEHDIVTIARVGWDDATAERNIKIEPGQNVKNIDPDVVPRYNIVSAQIDNLLQVCSLNGMGLILSAPDFYSHDQPDKSPGRLWSDATLQQNLIDFWTRTALKWKGQPGLIAYELINEPSPQGVYADMRNGSNSFKGLMELCIAAIRKQDMVTPIIVSPPRGSDISALDFYFDTDGSNRGANLLKDDGNRLVYTVHYYSPGDFCQQGIGAGSYHRLGTLYPNIVGNSAAYAADGSATGSKLRDYSATGMTDDFKNAQTFLQRYKLPVFLGEFSSSSSAYYQRVTSAGTNDGAFRESTPDSAERAIYNLYYCPNTQLGYMVLRAPIGLLDFTETDPNASVSGFSTKWPVNRVTIEIKSYGGTDIGVFNNLQVSGVLNGYRRWKDGNGVWQQDNEFLISFPWPNSTPPAAYVAYGAPSYYNSWTDSTGFKEAIQHLVDSQGGLIAPSGVRTVFSHYDEGYGMQKTAATATNPATYLPQPAIIASIKILLNNTQVSAQEASRVTHARDVLRQCSALGLSWAWFGETNILDSYLWGDKFWTVDHQQSTATGAGGNLRALLKRATNQSIA